VDIFTCIIIVGIVIVHPVYFCIDTVGRMCGSNVQDHI